MVNIAHDGGFMGLYEVIENTFPDLEKAFSREYLLGFMCTRVGDLYLYHFGMGTWIRNHLLWPGENHLYQLFLENNIVRPDDMSFHIIRLFHYYLSKRYKHDFWQILF